jgi:hypothetical protein
MKKERKSQDYQMMMEVKHSGMKDVLNQILKFLEKSHEKDMILREKENNLRESVKLDDERRHNDLDEIIILSVGMKRYKKTKKRKMVSNTKLNQEHDKQLRIAPQNPKTP